MAEPGTLAYGRGTYLNRSTHASQARVILPPYLVDKLLRASKRPLNPQDCPLALPVLSVKMDMMNALITFRVTGKSEARGSASFGDPLWLAIRAVGNSFWGGTSDGRD